MNDVTRDLSRASPSIHRPDVTQLLALIHANILKISPIYVCHRGMAAVNSDESDAHNITAGQPSLAKPAPGTLTE
jgi:hypothetical protein